MKIRFSSSLLTTIAVALAAVIVGAGCGSSDSAEVTNNQAQMIDQRQEGAPPGAQTK